VRDWIEQSWSIERPRILDKADHRRMFKSLRNRAPHGVLKGEIGASRRLCWISAARIVLIDRQRSIDIFQAGVLDASPERARCFACASVMARDRYPIDRYPIAESGCDHLLFVHCATLIPHGSSRGNSGMSAGLPEGRGRSCTTSDRIADPYPL
jgi:hypothetical protein